MKRLARWARAFPPARQIDPYAPADPRLREEIKAAIALIRPHTMVSLAGLTSLYEQARHCERVGISGAFVECGVWHGGASALMALANLQCASERRPLHLFDSFVGIPQPSAALDGARAVSEILKAGGAADGQLAVAYDYGDRGGPGSAEAVTDLLLSIGYEGDAIHIHQGWFQETVPRALPSIESIAILRLDGDWYESTKVCLDHLYDLVVPGGFVIADDYGTYEGCRRAVDEFLESLPSRPFLGRVNEDIRFLIKP